MERNTFYKKIISLILATIMLVQPFASTIAMAISIIPETKVQESQTIITTPGEEAQASTTPSLELPKTEENTKASSPEEAKTEENTKAPSLEIPETSIITKEEENILVVPEDKTKLNLPTKEELEKQEEEQKQETEANESITPSLPQGTLKETNLKNLGQIVEWHLGNIPKLEYKTGETIDLTRLTLVVTDAHQNVAIMTYRDLLADKSIQIHYTSPVITGPTQITITKAGLEDLTINLGLENSQETASAEANQEAFSLDNSLIVENFKLKDQYDFSTAEATLETLNKVDFEETLKTKITSTASYLNQEIVAGFKSEYKMTYEIVVNKSLIKENDYYTIRLSGHFRPRAQVSDLKSKDGQILAKAFYDFASNTIVYQFTKLIEQITETEKITVEENLQLDQSLASYTGDLDIFTLVAGTQQVVILNLVGQDLEDNRLVVKKVDPKGQALEGAKFALYNSADQKIKEDTTNVQGRIDFGKLEKGLYKIVEEEAPQGFEKTKDTYIVTVKEDGTTSWSRFGLTAQRANINSKLQVEEYTLEQNGEEISLLAKIKTGEEIKEGDYFTIKLDPNLQGPKKVPNLENQIGLILAEGTYDSSSSEIKYTFSKIAEGNLETTLAVNIEGLKLLKDYLNKENIQRESLIVNTIGEKHLEEKVFLETEANIIEGTAKNYLNISSKITDIDWVNKKVQYEIQVNPNKTNIDEETLLTISQEKSRTILDLYTTRVEVYGQNVGDGFSDIPNDVPNDKVEDGVPDISQLTNVSKNFDLKNYTEDELGAQNLQIKLDPQTLNGKNLKFVVTTDFQEEDMGLETKVGLSAKISTLRAEMENDYAKTSDSKTKAVELKKTIEEVILPVVNYPEEGQVEKLGNSTIIVENLDENNLPIVGSKYQISDFKTGEALWIKTSDINGKAAFIDLAPGEYLLEEIFTPEGYVSAGYKIQILVDENKNTSYKALKIERSELVELEPELYKIELKKEKEEIKEQAKLNKLKEKENPELEDLEIKELEKILGEIMSPKISLEDLQARNENFKNFKINEAENSTILEEKKAEEIQSIILEEKTEENAQPIILEEGKIGKTLNGLTKAVERLLGKPKIVKAAEANTELTAEDIVDDELMSTAENSESLAVPMFSANTRAMATQLGATPTIEATGSDVSTKVNFNNNVSIGTNGINIIANTQSDTFLLDLSFTFDDSIKSGDYFTIKHPNKLMPQSIVSSTNILDLKTKDGDLVAQAQYDENNRTIKYVFTSYMDNYKSVKGTLKQPFNLNPSSTTNGYDSFQIAGKNLTRNYYDYYTIDTNEKANDSYKNTIFQASIVEVDRDNKTFVQWIHVNPSSINLYKSTITVKPASGSNSVILNENTKVEIYTIYDSSGLNIYSPYNLNLMNNGSTNIGAIISKNNNEIEAYFGDNLTYNKNYYYNKLLLKITGSLDESDNPISLETFFSGLDYNNYSRSVTKNIYYSNQRGTSEFSGESLYKKVDFTINKVNENNEALKGATFKITGDTGMVWEIDGTDLSTFEFKQLPKGHYIIEETKTPDGYKKPSTYWQFTINVDEQDQPYITTPDFPMDIKTEENQILYGSYPIPYESLYSDLVRNPYNYEIEFKDDYYYNSQRKGTISKRIVDRLSANTYQVEVMVRVDPNQNIISGQIKDIIGNEFNLDLGADQGFAREDYSLTASDGSFLYIEKPGSASFVSGGEPFATDKILSGSKISYDKINDVINVENLNFTTKDKEVWIKLTYNLKFDFDSHKNLQKNTFYEIGNSSNFSWLDNSNYRKTQGFSVPAIRPIIHGKQTEMKVTVINFKEDANLEMKKVGEKRTYTLDGKFTTKIVGLQGAQFELFKASVNDVEKAQTTNKKIITNEEGKIFFQNLQRDFDGGYGNYRTTFYWLKELSSPNGYERAEDLIGPFRINYNGSVEFVGELPETIKKDDSDGLYHIKNKRINHLGELDIFKKAGDKELEGGKYEALSGSTFTLYWVDEINKKVDPLSSWNKFWSSTEVSQTITSEKDGRVFFKDLTEGYYRLEETKPAPGYVKTNTIWQVEVNSEGITKITDVTNQKDNSAPVGTRALTNYPMNGLMRSFSPSALVSSPYEPLNLNNILGAENRTSDGLIKVQKIDQQYYSKIYSDSDKVYQYTEPQNNFTGFEEKYINSTNTTELYTFNGSYKNLPLNEVAGVNKYIVPTGRPGEYTVHVRVKGNRVKSNLGVVIVYDNSNSMRRNIENIDRLTQANNAITNFTRKLVSPGSEETKVALVTYGSTLFPSYSTYTDTSPFTNDSETIIAKLPKTIPAERNVEGYGGTFTQGAIEKAKELLDKETFDNKVIVTVTDGVPTYSKLIKYIDSSGKYIFDTQKTGTGNRFINPYTYNEYDWITNLQQPYRAYYSDYWVEDRSKSYDPKADYANESVKYYYKNSTNKIEKSTRTEVKTETVPGYHYFAAYNGSGQRYSRVDYNVQGGIYYNRYYYYPDTSYGYYGRYYQPETTRQVNVTTNSLPNNGYGYKLINNHGYATIDSGKQIKNAGTQMYTIGIQITDSTISGSYNLDARRIDALEVMFGISSSKDTYFDAQNLDYLDVYLNQILAELEEQNPPTVNNGTLVDPMGEMVEIGQNEPIIASVKDVGSKKIPTEILDMMQPKYSYGSDGKTIRGITIENMNLGKDQEIELTYKVHLNTENPKYEQGKMYETNGETTLQPNGDYDKKWQLPIPKVSGPMVPMELSKQWQKSDGTPPENTHDVQVQLQRKLVGQDNEQYVNVPEYDEQGNIIDNPQPKKVSAPDWKIEYKNLIPFDKDGNVYEYRILEVNPDGAYTILYEGNGYSSTIINRERVKQDVVNQINKIDFLKVDSKTQNPLKNVGFQLLKDGELYVSQNTDVDGKLHFEKLPPGNYTLNEIETPTGYKPPVNPMKTFTVGYDGVIRIGTEEVKEEDIPFILENIPIEVEVKMKKVDGDDPTKVLSGAIFELYNSYTDGKIVTDKADSNGQYVSKEDGTIELGTLRVGAYYLKEIKGPNVNEGEDPYRITDGNIVFEVQSSGKIFMNKEAKDPSDPHLIKNYKEETTEIAIRKATPNKNDADGNTEIDTVSGASFKLTKIDENGDEIDTNTTTWTGKDEKGLIYGMFIQLKEGLYKIREVKAPIGYIRFAGNYTFEVVKKVDPTTQKVSYEIAWIKKHDVIRNSDGSFTPAEEGSLDPYKFNTEGELIYQKDPAIGKNDYIHVKGPEKTTVDSIGIQVMNDPNVLKFKKIDGEDPNKVFENVEFGLYYKVDKDEEETGYIENDPTTEIKLRKVRESKLLNSTVPDTDTTTVVTRKTDENGVISFEGLPQRNSPNPDVVFYVKELKAPEGYQINPYFIGPYTMTEDGIKDPNGNYIMTTGQLLSPDGKVSKEKDYKYPVTNYKTPDLQIIKLDALHKEITLAGAEFELYRATKNDTGAYQAIEAKDKVGETQITSNDGLAKFEKLEEGLYWVRESKAPQEYARILKDIGPFLVEKGKIYKVELDASGKIKTKTETDSSISEVREELTKIENTATYNLEVENKKAIYPSTGGIGTLAFTLVGGALMTGATIAGKKKKRE